MLNQIENTCSMQELTLHGTERIKDKQIFLATVRNYSEDFTDVDDPDPDDDHLNKLQCIIYNCQERTWEPLLHAIGFRKKHSYKGNNLGHDGKPVTINVWMLNITKKLRKEINKYK